MTRNSSTTEKSEKGATSEPALSVVLVASGAYKTIQKTVRHLRAQTVQDQMEVLLAVASKEQMDLAKAPTAAFHDFELIEVGPIASTAKARAPAIRRAQAPIVAFTEDHSFPEPDWAEQIIAAHEGPWAAVGPVVGNANPDFLLSWANLVIEYGPWLGADNPTEMDHLPGHNSAYKRDTLLEYGDQLADMLEAESVLHWDLREKGHRLLLDPAIRTNHLNFSRGPETLRLRFLIGRMFASSRAQSWPLWRRALYAAATPAIPVIRLLRAIRHVRQSAIDRIRIPSLILVLAGLLAVDGAGEATGYALGTDESKEALAEIELNRASKLTASERQLAFE